MNSHLEKYKAIAAAKTKIEAKIEGLSQLKTNWKQLSEDSVKDYKKLK